MRLSYLSVMICFFLFVSVAIAEESGVVTLKSSHSVKVTLDRLASALTEKGLTVFARIDHAKGAKTVGQTLPATELLIFGNPKVGTPLMACSRLAALDLPQKALAWEDKKGQAWLSYNDPAYLAKRHQLGDCNGLVTKVGKILGKFANGATAP